MVPEAAKETASYLGILLNCGPNRSSHRAAWQLYDSYAPRSDFIVYMVKTGA